MYLATRQNGAPTRFLKGLLAGFVLGLVYMVLLNVFGLYPLPGFDFSTAAYRQTMWLGGTAAMGVASGCYLLLLHWSAGLPYPTRRARGVESGSA